MRATIAYGRRCQGLHFDDFLLLFTSPESDQKKWECVTSQSQGFEALGALLGQSHPHPGQPGPSARSWGGVCGGRGRSCRSQQGFTLHTDTQKAALTLLASAAGIRRAPWLWLRQHPQNAGEGRQRGLLYAFRRQERWEHSGG